MTAQTKFLIKTAKYMLFDHNINHDILKDNKTQLIIEKKTTNVNVYMFIEWIDPD